ncbi:terminase small subunit [Ligilactobacillus acidipiscis]|uniref:terminase small subunit n=1 Tax=Ligilactobacillus acidipiscis TaxID=89059 RepID=UPI0023FA124A|nr:terminase small subunit [Ligilactobacillus acidipiscis]WEV56142.1 terminase small subunit [Ligilactobacillus acidipiscis]
MSKVKLNEKQLKFCREWLKNHNATQAAIKAGYSKNYAKNATIKLLGNVGIKEYINKRTSKVEKKEDSEVDAVLTNIYRIASGNNITEHQKVVDNLKKETTSDKTFTQPASQKQQIAAAELWMRIKGQFKNDNAEIEKAKARKLKAEAEFAETRNKEYQNINNTPKKIVIFDDVPKGDDADGSEDN